MASRKVDFAHLHNHTEYSMLDGAAKIKPMVAEAARLEQPALGITDHGYLFGAYEFYREATAAGIKPVIGLEAYVTPGTSRRDRTRVQWGEPWQREDDVSARGAYTHLTLLAYSTEGVHNLFRMGSEASLTGQFGKWPRIDRELMQRYHKGLMVFTGSHPVRFRFACALASGMRPFVRPANCATFSARTTSTSNSWTTASP